MSCTEEIDDFLNYLSTQRRVSPHTVESYSRVLHKAARALEQECSLNSFTKITAEGMRVLRRELNFGTEADLLSGNSVAHDLYALSSFFKYLVRQDRMDSNPALLSKAPKVKRPLPRVLSAAEIELLLDAIVGEDRGAQRDRAMVELLYASGLRVSELVALNLADLDCERMEVRVLGKGGKERVVPFGTNARRALQQYLASGRKDFAPPPGESAVFLNRFGGRLTTRAVQIMLEKLAEKSGLYGQVSPHKLRHSFATEILGGGADIRLVQELLGHASLAATQIYTHIDMDRLRAAYAKAHPRDSMSDAGIADTVTAGSGGKSKS